MTPSAPGPHQGQPVFTTGAPLSKARAAAVLVHGRGGSAEGILLLADDLQQNGVAYLAPQAHGHTWYPYSFLAPLAQNEPGLRSGLRAIGAVLARLAAAGLPAERTMLMGFSQGACLALEYAARHPQRYGAVVGLSGGLLGYGERGDNTPPPGDKTFDYPGALQGTPVFLGCSDVDAHIPLARVQATTAALRALGADVTERIYPGMGHTTNDDEIAFVRSLLAPLGT